jgi:hypothetical protein
VKGQNRIKLGLHLFDTMIAPILYYGCEVFGFSKLEKIERVATRFYKRILCLPRSAASAGVEIVLGRYRLEVEIKYRIIKYWFRITTQMNHERIPYLAYQRDRIHPLVSKKNNPWATSVRKLLGELDFSYVWERQDEIDSEEAKGLLPAIKIKLKEQSRKEQLSDCYNLPSTAHLPHLLLDPGKELHHFKQTKAHGLRINLARLALKCPGGMMIYSELGNKCRACLRFLNKNIFIHRLYDCPRYQMRRKLVHNKKWFSKGKVMPCNYYLTYLLKYKKFESLPFFY